MATPDTSSDWPCTWDTHEIEQLKHGMRLTFRQKMQWLEDTTAFVQKLQAASRRTTSEMQAVLATPDASKKTPA
jgi:hypothetical protein